jgi:tetratricopeptide (TPR) repeat protein
MTRRTLSIVLLGMALVGLAAPHGAWAAGGGGGGDAGASAGKPQDPDYTSGVAAIKANQFARAIPLLEKATAKDPKSADAYNWLAYAVRKNGDPAASIPIYEKALALDPKHRGAHEYIGEAYLALNDLPKAKQHLQRLDKLCFLPCEEYSDLKRAVEAYEKKASR